MGDCDLGGRSRSRLVELDGVDPHRLGQYCEGVGLVERHLPYKASGR